MQLITELLLIPYLGSLALLPYRFRTYPNDKLKFIAALSSKHTTRTERSLAIAVSFNYQRNRNNIYKNRIKNLLLN